MTMTTDNLGVLGNLATALGLFADGEPNPDWFGHPDTYLKTMLAEEKQRDALVAFVDDALGGADRTTDAAGAVWLPIVSLDAPDPPLDIAITIDDSGTESVALGLGIAVRTANPTSRTTLQIPLFRAAQGTSTVSNPFLLGQVGGRIRIGTSITVDSTPAVPGEARLGSIGLDFDIPTAVGDDDPVFGLSLLGLQLPGATTPTDIRISADGADELDDAVLDLVLALVRAQAEGAGDTPLGAIAGLLGLDSTDSIPDFPIEGIVTQGVPALAQWFHDLITVTAQRQDWLAHLADLLGDDAAQVGDEVELELGVATLRIGVHVDTGPSGNALVTPTLSVSVGDDTKRIEARADVCRIDLVTGSAVALPSFGVWAAVGASGAGNRVLDLTSPTVARADTLRVGFGLDAARQLTFVLAADQVRLGTHDYPTLDLTSPDAVMDAAGNAIEDVANELLGNLADALAPARVLLGLDAPPGAPTAPTISLAVLLTDPVGAVAGHWQSLLADHRPAIPAALGVLRDALSDAVAATKVIQGTGTELDPWRMQVIRPLELQVWTDGDKVSIAVAANTFIDTLGQQCTVIETRIAATLAEIDLANRTASLLKGVDARLLGRERGIVPSRAQLTVSDGVAIRASYAGIRLGWSADAGLVAAADFPDLALLIDNEPIPIGLPTIDADGNVTLPAEGWNAVQSLVTYLAGLMPDFFTDVTDVLGWTGIPDTTSKATTGLRLADLVDDPGAALTSWVAGLVTSELAPRAITLLADLFSAAGSTSGHLLGTGHPDDPYRLDLQPGVPVPELVVWFPPEGLEPRVANAPESIRSWRPGQPGLPPSELAHALAAEAVVARDIAELIEGRDLVSGLTELTARWVGGDGRIVPPASAPTGVTVGKLDCAAGQLLANLDLDDQLGLTPTTIVYVALGSSAWPDRPAAHRVDLTAPGLAPTMFATPPQEAGDWFVALGERADCRLAAGDDDGTFGQAARLRRVLDALAPLGTDLVVVGLAGAGHACRLAAEQQPAVSDVITLGMPLGPVALTALTTQPIADAWRLLHRLLPTQPAPAATGDEPLEDADVALARSLVGALLELSDRADAASELRSPTTAPTAPRGGLTVTALFGVVDAAQVSRAITAAVAAGLAERARLRAQTPLAPATGIRAGIRFGMPPTSTGGLTIQADGLLTLFGYDQGAGLLAGRELRVRATVGDRLGWLTATPDLELRRVTADVRVPLGSGAGTATLTLHDARVFGQSWERLVLGAGPGAVPLLPEARVLLASAVQRLTSDATGAASVALTHLLQELGLVAAGGAVFDAFDQLIHDPGGLVRDRLAAGSAAIEAAVGDVLGPLGATIDLAAQQVTFTAGSDVAGRFGWHGTATISPTAVAGSLTFGSTTPDSPAGALQLVMNLAPFTAELHWHRPGSGVDVIELWPSPDATAIARAIATAAPSIGGHAALELTRGADELARPIIDAALDALGLLGGVSGQPQRPLRPLAGLLADPAGWLRSADSLAASPAKIQGLFDAMRPLLGVAGSPGDPWQLADGVTLAVVPQGSDARLELTIDASGWTAPAGSTDRFGAGLTASVTVSASGPPAVGLDVYVGLPDADPGRQAVHARLDETGISVFARPSAGADISLVPFAGLGGLAEVAAMALPFLLDKLADVPGTVGDVVEKLGDALALRTTTAPKHFDQARLSAWEADPAAALTAAVPSIVSTGLTTLAPLIDALVPTAVTVTSTSTKLTATVGPVSLGWTPTSGRVAVSGNNIDVPGIEHLTFTVAVSGAGLDELSVSVGPAEIEADTATLRPYVTVAGGNAPTGGRRILVGLAVDDTHRFAARWLLDSHQFALVASDGPIAAAVDDSGVAALRAVEVVADLVVAVAMATDAVSDLLDTDVFDSTVRNLLAGVILEDDPDPTALIDGIFDPATLMDRTAKLFENVAAANISFTVDGQLTISLKEVDNVIGLEASLAQRWPLVEGDVSLWLENDDSWIEDNPAGPGGLFVGFLDTSAGLEFKPSLGVYGVGLRIGKMSGPLLDLGLTLESVALHAFAELDMSGAKAGGVQLQLSNLGLSTSGATGGNGIAAGIMSNTGSQPPKPAFSPALAIQKHGTDPVHVTLRAGDGDGPWWIAIQKGFGPLYLEQVGLGVVMPSQKVERISLLMDGSVSMFGLTCAVDDLQITYLVSKNDFFNPQAWDIDLAGLAVSADMGGLVISGGLLKQQTGSQIEYLGMLLARFGVYGITIYGGYGEGEEAGQKFVAFFAVGSVVGPIGGPPAFFLTGIGGGFGINRSLVLPTDLSKFGDYPLIKALDVAAKPGNPMAELRALGTYFPMKRGNFWFAAGLSFNSFALVDGIAVVAIEVGDGLDINLLGLARMALPRPQVAIVSIEIALLVRFSSSEGVLWVQGQLTDNSWLLYPDVRLTGGFAFVTWFKGEYRGQFVLTLGGYHPDFKKPGYPQVPRLGLRWSFGDNIVVQAGSYFALTSEAVMAGGDFVASASFGPAWAEVRFGANGIVYFDPFRYQIEVHASIDAGVTIDTWIFGEITISIHIGARIEVEGPDFHGKATLEVGPIELTVEIGSSEQTRKELLGADAFVTKYLEPTSDGACTLSVLTTFGTQPSGGGKPTPDGTPDRPYVVVAEFGLIVTSTVPVTDVTPSGGMPGHHAPTRVLGVAPMGTNTIAPTLALSWEHSGTPLAFPFHSSARPYGAFPIGVWGPPQDDNHRKTPKGDVVEALTEVSQAATATISAGGPEIPYYQVEIGKRLPLPFKRPASEVAKLRSDSKSLSLLVTQPATTSAAFATALSFLATTASPTALAALQGERQAPPRAGTLGERLDTDAITVIPDIQPAPATASVDSFVEPPIAVGILRGGSVATNAVAQARTTVRDAARLWRTAPPTIATVDLERSRSFAATLVISEALATSTMRSAGNIKGRFDSRAASTSAGSVIATGSVPTTAIAHAPSATVARVGGESTDRLRGFDTALTAKRRTRSGDPGATLQPGDVAILRMPNAHRDVGDAVRPGLGVVGAPARVLAIGHGGTVLADTVVGDSVQQPQLTVAASTERLVLIGLGMEASQDAGLDGWHSGAQLPYLGWSSAVGRGCTVRALGERIAAHRERLDAGWVTGAELARGLSTVTTRFSAPVRTLLIALDDPTAFGGEVVGRQLLLGLDGAARVTDAAGNERPPVLLTSENRSVLAYEVAPASTDASTPVTVTIATEQGWSLVAVMGSVDLPPEAAIALVSARGLDAALRPLAPGTTGSSRLVWLGETRTRSQRRAAR